MKSLARIFALIFLFVVYYVVVVVAQEGKPASRSVNPSASQSTSLPAPAPAPPTIPDAHRAQFFKTQLELSRAAQAYQSAQTAFQSAVADLAKDCGGERGKFSPQMDSKGDPVCMEKPKPAAAPNPAENPEKPEKK